MGYIRDCLIKHRRVASVASENRDDGSCAMWIGTKEGKQFQITLLDEDKHEPTHHTHDYTELDQAIVKAIFDGINTQAAIMKAVSAFTKTAWNSGARKPVNIVQSRLQRLSRKRVIRYRHHSRTWALEQPHLI